MLDILLPDPKILARRPDISSLAVGRRQETTRSPLKRKIVCNEKDCR
jgi:hypothetical protein